MAALFARLWLSRSVIDPVGLTVAKPFRSPTLSLATAAQVEGAPRTERPVPAHAAGALSLIAA
jgi:hypothetical protein